MNPPDVSVIVPVHNCRAYLPRCLDSLLGQSIGRARLEVVAVDDGSTDGSSWVLDAYAAAYPGVVRVFHTAASGGPSRPRNMGLDRAFGRYVFFCDADDYMGPCALEAMVAMADRNASDIVLGKVVGVGRRTPHSMFGADRERVDLGTSLIYNSASVFKLFSREFLRRHGLRFDQGMRLAEDTYFVIHAYLHAEVISVVASHDCYYLVERPNGTSITQEAGNGDPMTLMALAHGMFSLVARHVPPGSLRDHLHARHFRWDVLALLDERLLTTDSTPLVDLAGAICAQWLTPGVLDRLVPAARLRAHCALHGLRDELLRIIRSEAAPRRAMVSSGRVYAGYPVLPGIPLSRYEHRRLVLVRAVESARVAGRELRIRGHAYIEHVETVDQRVEVILRPRSSVILQKLARFPATSHPTPELARPPYEYAHAGFSATIPLPPGRWDVAVRVVAQGVAAEGRLKVPALTPRTPYTIMRALLRRPLRLLRAH